MDVSLAVMQHSIGFGAVENGVRGKEREAEGAVDKLTVMCCRALFIFLFSYVNVTLLSNSHSSN